MPRWPGTRVPEDQRPEIAWKMRQSDPPSSWKEIDRAFGLRSSGGSARFAFAQACRARNLGDIFSLWEDRARAEFVSVDALRTWLERSDNPHPCSPQEVDEYCESARRWFEWDEARRGQTWCPTCHGQGWVTS